MRSVGCDAVDLAQLLGEQVGAVQLLVEFWMRASLSCWRSVRLSGFFHSANRAPLSSLASCLLPARRASFQTSRRISSSASVAALTMWNGSRHMVAFGQRSAIGPVIHEALSQETSLICCAALIAEQIQELLDGLAVPAGAPPTPAGRCRWSTTTVRYLLPLANRDLVDPEPLQAREHVAPLALLGHHPLADPADRPPRDPHQLAIALLFVFTASHAPGPRTTG